MESSMYYFEINTDRVTIMHKWLPLVLMITSIITLLEVYFLYHWKKFVESIGKSRVWWIAPAVATAFVVALAAYINISRLYNPQIVLHFNFLLLLVSFWYLPKLIILPFLIGKDILKLFKYINFLLRNKQNIAKHSNSSQKSLEERRSFLSKASWAMALIPYSVAGWGILSTTSNVKVHSVKLDLFNFPELLKNFKIVQISDLHAGSYYSIEQFREVRQTVNSLNPDIVVITGDFVNFHRAELDVIKDELLAISSKYGVYGCLGNHDHYVAPEEFQAFLDDLENCGVRVLMNDNVSIDTGIGVVQIAGVDNTGMKQNFADFDKALVGLNESNSTFLLCHDPNNWEKSIVGKRKVDLTLSGHTHGGQFGVNILGHEISPASFVYKQSAGLYQIKDQYIYVNRGVGMTGPPFRVGVNPEVTFFVLNRASNLV